MRFLFLAVTLSLLVAPVQAEDVTGPKEVGSTTMPPGQYAITEKISKKSYSLTVTDKGNMILGPATDDAAASTTAAGTTSAASSATTGTSKATASEAAADKANSLMPSFKKEAFNGLMKQGVQRGVQEGTNQLQNLMTK